MMTETTAEHDVWIVVAPGLERVLCQELLHVRSGLTSTRTLQPTQCCLQLSFLL